MESIPEIIISAHNTPVSNKSTNPMFYTPTSVSRRSRYNIEKWLEDVDCNENVTETFQLHGNHVNDDTSDGKQVIYQEEFYCTPLKVDKEKTNQESQERKESLVSSDSSASSFLRNEKLYDISYTPNLRRSIAVQRRFMQSPRVASTLSEIKENDTKSNTPEEPILLTMTSSLLQKENQEGTPEEPLLSETTVMLLRKENEKQNSTPEEPVLSDATVNALKEVNSEKDHSVLSNTTNTYQLNDKKLIDNSKQNYSFKVQTTPPYSNRKERAPFRTFQTSMVNISEDDELKSPELSEVTINFLRNFPTK